MNNIDMGKLEKTLTVLEELFVSKDFQGIEKVTSGVRLRATEISDAVLEYPDELLGLDRASLDIIRVDDKDRLRWSVNIRFKTRTGSSDLTLSLFVEDCGLKSDLYNTEIADIHLL